jgi:hypothetical protein
MGPRTGLAPTHNQTTAGRRGEKAARRAVLVQCDRCKVNGTGTSNARGRLASVNLRAEMVAPGHWRHRDCGGGLVAFDIGGGS